MATMSPAVGLLERHALEAAERQHLGDAAGFDQLAVVVEHLYGLVRLHRTGRDAAGDDAAEIGIGFENRAEQAERAFLDLRRPTCFSTSSNSGFMPSSCDPSRLLAIQPCLAEP